MRIRTDTKKRMKDEGGQMSDAGWEIFLGQCPTMWDKG